MIVKLILFLLTIFALGFVAGAKYKQRNAEKDKYNREEYDKENGKGRFYYITSDEMPEGWDEDFDVYVDKRTRVQYIKLNYDEGITALLDPDGKPILYKGDFKE